MLPSSPRYVLTEGHALPDFSWMHFYTSDSYRKQTGNREGERGTQKRIWAKRNLEQGQGNDDDESIKVVPPPTFPPGKYDSVYDSSLHGRPPLPYFTFLYATSLRPPSPYHPIKTIVPLPLIRPLPNITSPPSYPATPNKDLCPHPPPPPPLFCCHALISIVRS